jgi:Streptomycin adenylyltransferase
LPDALQQRAEQRQALLDRIVERLKADERFVAAWLTGSLGRQTGDSLSDIDLTIVVRERAFETLGGRPWMIAGRTTGARLALFKQFGEPAIIHENQHNAPDDGSFTAVINADHGITVDWTLVSEHKAVMPAVAVTLFDKTDHPFDEKQDAAQSQQERAEAASERVAFFWMMMTVVVKYMLRRDQVYFHMLADMVERTLTEVARLVEGRSWTYRSGSAVRLAVTQREQIALVRQLAARMLELMPQVVTLGGYIPDDPMRVIEQLLSLSPTDESNGA